LEIAEKRSEVTTYTRSTSVVFHMSLTLAFRNTLSFPENTAAVMRDTYFSVSATGKMIAAMLLSARYRRPTGSISLSFSLMQHVMLCHLTDSLT